MVMSSDAVSSAAAAAGAPRAILFTGDVVDAPWRRRRDGRVRANVEPSHVSARVARPDDAVGGAVQRAHAVGGGTTSRMTSRGDGTRRAQLAGDGVRGTTRPLAVPPTTNGPRTPSSTQQRFKPIRIAREREPPHVVPASRVPHLQPPGGSQTGCASRGWWQSRETRSPSPLAEPCPSYETDARSVSSSAARAPDATVPSPRDVVDA